MATKLEALCWRAWWEELTTDQRHYWHTTARRPYLTAEQVQLLCAEGLPLVTIHTTSDTTMTTEHVLFPIDLADLLAQDAADR